MPSIEENLQAIRQQLPKDNFTLVAVSKTKPVAAILEAYNAGQRDFGENKVQEMVQKHAELPQDIRWHLIGHLQRNKVKAIAPFVHLIHSVDSEKLLQEINKEAAKNDRVIPCLLQVHIAEEDTKFGFDEEEMVDFLSSGRLGAYSHVRVVGLMGMATFTEDNEQVGREFSALKLIFDTLNSYETLLAKNNLTKLSILSMGMSGDYGIAVEEGSNMVRIGSAIFGERNYQGDE